MAAPNAQPAGNRPGPGTPHTHAPHQAGMPAESFDNTTTVSESFGEFDPEEIRQNPVAGGNKNVLH